MIEQYLHESSYLSLPETFYSLIETAPPPHPEWVVFNQELARDLGLKAEADQEDLAILSGLRPPSHCRVLAQAYSGHQFGHFTKLGDGRAAVLGEIPAPDGTVWELQLKGSGPTPYARRGDGKAVLGPMLREHAIGEYLNAFGIPTTRALSVVSTGEPVWRDDFKPGAVLCRVASSHLRVGTFEHFAYFGTPDQLRLLADYAIERHYPSLRDSPQRYIELAQQVGQAQAELVARWMALGFVHGVMNTDNVSISGQSIDFGPCAFLDTYRSNQTFSSIDTEGRYAWGRQPAIAAWNHARFTEALIPILADKETVALDLAQKLADEFGTWMLGSLRKHFGYKLGLGAFQEGDDELLNGFLVWMEKTQADYTRTFVHLTDWLAGRIEQPPAIDSAWLNSWRNRLDRETDPLDLMKTANPRIIPRNWVLQRALDSAEAGDLEPYRSLVQQLLNPRGDDSNESATPDPQRPFVTYCGT